MTNWYERAFAAVSAIRRGYVRKSVAILGEQEPGSANPISVCDAVSQVSGICSISIPANIHQASP